MFYHCTNEKLNPEEMKTPPFEEERKSQTGILSYITGVKKKMKKLLIMFSSLAFFALPIHKESFGFDMVTTEEKRLNLMELDSVVAGNVSPRLTGKYEGVLVSDPDHSSNTLSGTIKFVVKRNGKIRGSVKFSDGNKGRVLGSMGSDGTFGTMLVNIKKWGLGGLWGRVDENLSSGSGDWSRPNNFSGVFSIRKK